jgi:hypothetical protein
MLELSIIAFAAAALVVAALHANGKAAQRIRVERGTPRRRVRSITRSL